MENGRWKMRAWALGGVEGMELQERGEGAWFGGLAAEGLQCFHAFGISESALLVVLAPRLPHGAVGGFDVFREARGVHEGGGLQA
jgi:hypothetical protein